MNRNQYSDSFKAEAVKLALSCKAASAFKLIGARF